MAVLQSAYSASGVAAGWPGVTWRLASTWRMASRASRAGSYTERRRCGQATVAYDRKVERSRRQLLRAPLRPLYTYTRITKAHLLLPALPCQ